MDGRCKTCAYWENQMGDMACDFVGRVNSSKPDGFDIDIRVSDDTGLYERLLTGPEFGCVHHQEK